MSSAILGHHQLGLRAGRRRWRRPSGDPSEEVNDGEQTWPEQVVDLAERAQFLLTLHDKTTDPTRFQTDPPACYRASWQLPGPDSHRHAMTS
jgi:hypothetical protein